MLPSTSNFCDGDVIPIPIPVPTRLILSVELPTVIKSTPPILGSEFENRFLFKVFNITGALRVLLKIV